VSSGLKNVPENLLISGLLDLRKISEYPMIKPFPSSKLNAVGKIVDGISNNENAVL